MTNNNAVNDSLSQDIDSDVAEGINSDMTDLESGKESKSKINVSNASKERIQTIVIEEGVEIYGLKLRIDRMRVNLHKTSISHQELDYMERGLTLVSRYIKHTGNDLCSLSDIDPIEFVSFLLMKIKPTQTKGGWADYQRYARSILLVKSESKWSEALVYLESGEVPKTGANV